MTYPRLSATIRCRPTGKTPEWLMDKFWGRGMFEFPYLAIINMLDRVITSLYYAGGY